MSEPWVCSLDREEERDCVMETCVCWVDRLFVSWTRPDMANRAYLGLESHSRSRKVSFRFLLNEKPKLTHWNLRCARQSASSHRTTKCTNLYQAVVSRSMPCKSTISSNQWQYKHTEQKQVQPIHHRIRAASSLS